MKISRTFRFEAAHRLINDTGKCHNIHGHSYRVQVILECNFALVKESRTGMLMHFNHLKQIFEKQIIDQYDHALLVNRDDDFLMRLIIEDPVMRQMKYLIFYCETTAENIAYSICKQLRQAIDTPINQITIRVWETQDCYAECSSQDIVGV